MKLIVKNLRPVPYSLDVGPFPNAQGQGGMIRATLAMNGTPGDSLDIGTRVAVSEFNVAQFVRTLISPTGSATVTTPVAGGYMVTANPPGALSLTVLSDSNEGRSPTPHWTMRWFGRRSASLAARYTSGAYR